TSAVASAFVNPNGTPLTAIDIMKGEKSITATAPSIAVGRAKRRTRQATPPAARAIQNAWTHCSQTKLGSILPGPTNGIPTASMYTLETPGSAVWVRRFEGLFAASRK